MYNVGATRCLPHPPCPSPAPSMLGQPSLTSNHNCLPESSWIYSPKIYLKFTNKIYLKFTKKNHLKFTKKCLDLFTKKIYIWNSLKYIFPSPLLNAHLHRHQCLQPSLTMISRENKKFPEADFFRRCHSPPRPRRPTAGGGTVVSCRPPLYPRAGVINREYLL